MKELLISLASGLVENPDAVEVKVDEPNAEGVTVYHLHVAQDLRKERERVAVKQMSVQWGIGWILPKIREDFCKHTDTRLIGSARDHGGSRKRELEDIGKLGDQLGLYLKEQIGLLLQGFKAMDLIGKGEKNVSCL